MTRILFALFSCLLMFGQLKAQTDSTQPPGSRDTNVITPVAVRRDSAIRRLSPRDSLRRDSILRRRRAVRDSLKLVAAAAHADSVRMAAGKTASGSGAADSSVAGRAPAPRDSTRTTGKPVRKEAPPLARVAVEAPAMTFWQKDLTANPDFNFTGKPVVEIFEIHHPNSKDSLFYLLVLILFYFALIRIFFEKYFNNLMTLFFRVSLRQQQIREQVLQTPLPSLLLNILFIVSAGLYACFLLHYSRIGEDVSFWWLYLNCMTLLAAIYLVKFVVLKFVGWVFSISRATDIYIFVVFLVNKMMGIFLLPFLILITFSAAQTREIFITLSLAMVFALWGYRVLASYRPVRNEMKLTPFYFFLYLCAFEIAPLLLIYKVLLTYLEKVY
jgi:hypothetical protein